MGFPFVGFGLGSIQTGLFLHEAQRVDAFDRYVIAETDAPTVDAVKRAGGRVQINIAHADHVEHVTLSNIEIYSPHTHKEEILSAIGQAREMATAIPSVALYEAGEGFSVADLLARGLAGDRPQVLYAAENHNQAAEILTTAVRGRGGRLSAFQAVNTVIGKMSGYVGSAATAASLGLEPMVPRGEKALLAESFNRILISRIALDGFSSSFPTFEEKKDLLPFEEAKLYGHNAVHAVLGYLAASQGYDLMSDIVHDDGLLDTARRCFLQECGPALTRRHASLEEPLFSASGWRSYAEDLLTRMTNPYLRDPVARVCRDPERKLGWDDRLVGAMRLVMTGGGVPTALAIGARAAVAYLAGMSGTRTLRAGQIRAILADVWGSGPPAEDRRVLADLIVQASILVEPRGKG